MPAELITSSNEKEGDSSIPGTNPMEEMLDRYLSTQHLEQGQIVSQSPGSAQVGKGGPQGEKQPDNCIGITVPVTLPVPVAFHLHPSTPSSAHT